MLPASLPHKPPPLSTTPLSYAMAAAGKLPPPTLEAAFHAASAQPDPLAGMELAYRLLRQMCTQPCGGEAHASPAQRLLALLPQVLRLPEQSDAPVLFTAWFELAREWLGEAALPSTLAGIDAAGGPSSTDALIGLAGRMALQAMRHLDPARLEDRLAPLLDWLIEQPPAAAREGLEAFGTALHMSSHLQPEHVRALFQMLADRAARIEEAGAWPAIAALVEQLGSASAGGFLRPQVETLLGALRLRRHPPEGTCGAILQVLARSTLAPGLDDDALSRRLPPVAELLHLPGLRATDALQAGRCMAEALGGPAIDPSAVAWLVRTNVAGPCDSTLAGAFLRGLIRGMGGAGSHPARVDALANALLDPAPDAAPQLRHALALEAAVTLGLSAAHADTTPPRAFSLGAGACAWLAPRHLDLAIAAAAGLLQQPGTLADPLRFEELSAPLVSQAVRAASAAPIPTGRAEALAGLFHQFACTGSAPAARRGRTRGAPAASGPAPAERNAPRAARWLIEQASELEGGAAGTALAPLTQALRLMASGSVTAPSARL